MIVTYYFNIFRAWTQQPRTADDLYWSIIVRISKLWNAPCWVSGKTIAQLTVSTKSDRLAKVLSRFPALTVLVVLLWPWLMLVSILLRRKDILRQWRIACKRPDIVLTFPRPLLTEADCLDLRPDFVAGFFDAYDFNRTRAPFFQLNDKLQFSEACHALGLPTPECYSLDQALAIGGPWIVKDPNLDGGKGIHFVNDAEQLKSLVQGSPFIIQKKLRNSSELIHLVGPEAPLSTFRIITVRDRRGVSVAGNWLRMGRHGTHVDNASLGGIASLVDPDGHWLHAAASDKQVVYGYSASNPLLLIHPDSGATLESVRLTSAGEAEDLALLAHQKLASQAASIGWDIASTDEGLMLIEANFFAGSFLPKTGSRLFAKSLEAMFIRYQEIHSRDL